MHILFITTSNLATNPRILKEVRLAIKSNIKVTLLCFSFDNWSRIINEQIKEEIVGEIDYIEIPGNRKPFTPWLMSTIMFEWGKFMLKIFPENAYWLSAQSNKRSYLLKKYLDEATISPDLVVAHNIGSFYPAWMFAKKKNCRLGIDLEDYHPGETNNPVVSGQIKRLLNHCLSQADYITSASKFILEESLKEIQVSAVKNVVMNYFDGSEFRQPVLNIGGPLRLIWFSQNISFGRGLEQVVALLEELDDVELDLFGNCNPEFYNQWLKGRRNITLYEARPQQELHGLLSEYDAGLAIEPGKDRNNELAISNKLLAYFQAGLYIIASNTLAQAKFLNENPHSGLVLNLHASDLQDRLKAIIASKESIRRTRAERFKNAQTYNWEAESEKLLQLWEGVGSG